MRRLVLGVLTASVLLVAGCGGNDPSSSTGPTGAGTTSSATTASASPSPDPTTAPPPSTGPAPATGPVVQSSLASVHAPADWRGTPTDTGLGGTVTGPTVEYTLNLNDLETAAEDNSIDALAELSQESGFNVPPLKRRDDVTVAGQPAYVLSGKDSIFGGWAEEYGMRYQGHSITIAIGTPLDVTPSERDQLSGAILASVELR